jgi:Mg2+ and Co2+ transporter CorA
VALRTQGTSGDTQVLTPRALRLADTELDQRRNSLISVDLMVTFGGFLLSGMSAVAGIFGMNIRIPLEDSSTTFMEITLGATLAVVGLWLLFVYAGMRSGLMNGLDLTWR